MSSLSRAKTAEIILQEAKDSTECMRGIGFAILALAEVLWEKLK